MLVSPLTLKERICFFEIGAVHLVSFMAAPFAYSCLGSATHRSVPLSLIWLDSITNFWFAPPLQVHTCTLVPSTTLPSTLSKHKSGCAVLRIESSTVLRKKVLVVSRKIAFICMTLPCDNFL